MSAVGYRRVSESGAVKKGLSSTALKGIAALCMTVDHIAFLFVPFGSILWCILRFVGRFAMPIFCFQLAEGCIHTRNMRRYMGRLGGLAILSQLPFSWMSGSGELTGLLPLSVVVTLLCGAAAVWALQSGLDLGIRLCLFSLCALAACFSDWGAVGVLWISVFWYFRSSRVRQFSAYFLIAAAYWLQQFCTVSVSERLPVLVVTSGMFLAPLFLGLYNGRRGKRRFSGWGCYLYYPVHMTLLTGLYTLLH